MRFYFAALLALGVTIGVMHAITVSSATDSVLQIIGAVLAAVLGLLVGENQSLNDKPLLSRSLPIVSGIVAILLGGYWVGWAGGKAWTNHHLRTGTLVAELSPRDQADAQRLMAVYDSLGVDPNTARKRMDVIAGEISKGLCRRLDLGERLDVLNSVREPARDCGFEALGGQLERANPALTSYLQDPARAEGPARSLRLELQKLPASQSLAAFSSAVGAGTCALPPPLAERLKALVRLNSGCMPSFAAELDRVLQTAPEISGGSGRRGSMLNEEFVVRQ